MPNTCRHPKSPCTDVSHSTRGSLRGHLVKGLLMSPARPSLTLNRGKLPSRVFDSPRRREKVKPVDARGGRKEGEFKQACLIDASVFLLPCGLFC